MLSVVLEEGFIDGDVDVEDQDEEGAEFNRKVVNCSASALGGRCVEWVERHIWTFITFERRCKTNQK